MFDGARCWPLSWCLPIPRPTSSLLQMDSPTNPFSSLSLLSDRNPSSFFLFFHFFCLLVVPSFLQRKGEKWRTWHWPYLPTFCVHKKMKNNRFQFEKLGWHGESGKLHSYQTAKKPLSPYFSLENHEWETLNKRYRIEREKNTPFFFWSEKKGNGWIRTPLSPTTIRSSHPSFCVVFGPGPFAFPLFFLILFFLFSCTPIDSPCTLYCTDTKETKKRKKLEYEYVYSRKWFRRNVKY